ncbi:MAG TPA: NAD-dependent epimerase/dehydratase family protein [Aggregatilineales bacterium]|nr:NAD-dependent epimerase/dehydratase family protein [Aggregatilineales bacterium]
MRILVIGGTQFIGLALVNQLHTMGHTVGVFHRGQSDTPLPDGVVRILGDMNQLTDSRADFATFAPDVVLHNMVMNTNHVNQLIDAFSGMVSRIVMTSSMDVYRDFGRLLGIEDSPIETDILTEESPLRTVLYPHRSRSGDDPNHLFYHYDKIPCEDILLHTPNIKGTVLRLPMVIGERDKQRRLYGFLNQMQSGRKAIVMDEDYAKWRSTYGYVENVAKAMALACLDDRASGRIYNVADGIFDSLSMAQKVKSVLNWEGRFVVLPSNQLPEVLRFGSVPQSLQVSSERIERELGFVRDVTFDEGVARTLAWDIANPLPTLPPQFEPYYEAQDAVLATLND